MEILTRACRIDNKIAIASKSFIGILIISKIISTTKTVPLFTGIAYIYSYFIGPSTGFITIWIDSEFVMKYYWVRVIDQIELTRNVVLIVMVDTSHSQHMLDTVPVFKTINSSLKVE